MIKMPAGQKKCDGAVNVYFVDILRPFCQNNRRVYSSIHMQGG
jgi:hypothetical protein